MTKQKIYNEIKEIFLFHFNQSIKVKEGDSIFYLYDKDLILKYKLSKINNTKFKLPKNIEWKDNIVLFEQDKKNKDFRIKYSKYWSKIQSKYLLDWMKIRNIIKHILDNNTICKQYIPNPSTGYFYIELDNNTNCKQYIPGLGSYLTFPN